jgi:hypothetical protein
MAQILYTTYIGAAALTKLNKKHYICQIMNLKVQVSYRIDEDTYNRLAVISNRKGLTVPQLTRLIVKQYLDNNTNGTKKTPTN